MQLEIFIYFLIYLFVVFVHKKMLYGFDQMTKHDQNVM